MGLLSDEAAHPKLSAALDVCADLYHRDRADDALEVALESLKASRQIGSDAYVRRFLTAEGILRADLQQLPQAYEAFSDAIAIAEREGDAFGLGSVWSNAATMLAYAEFPLACISAANRAMEYAAHATAGPQRDMLSVSAYSNAAYGCLLANKVSRGLNRCGDALRILDQYNTEPVRRVSLHFLRPNILAHQVRLFIKARLTSSAALAADRIRLLSGSRSLNERPRALIETVLAMTQAYTGEFDKGVAQLEKLAEGSQCRSPTLRIDAYQDLIQAHVDHGRDDEARAYLQDLTGYMRTVRAVAALSTQHWKGGWLARASETRTNDWSLFSATVPVRSSNGRLNLYEKLDELAIAAELREDSSGLHPHRVGELCREMALQSGMSVADAENLARAARLHDVGKIALPGHLLSKPDPLETTEQATIRCHGRFGAELIRSLNAPEFETAALIAEHHHEWWSGAGYPEGLSGKRIPMEARIAAIAESFDAMTHDRPYRPKMRLSRALGVVAERSGTQFDPQLAPLLATVAHRILAAHGDLDAYLERSALESPFLRAKRHLSMRISGRSVIA